MCIPKSQGMFPLNVLYLNKEDISPIMKNCYETAGKAGNFPTTGTLCPTLKDTFAIADLWDKGGTCQKARRVYFWLFRLQHDSALLNKVATYKRTTF